MSEVKRIFLEGKELKLQGGDEASLEHRLPIVVYNYLDAVAVSYSKAPGVLISVDLNDSMKYYVVKAPGVLSEIETPDIVGNIKDGFEYPIESEEELIHISQEHFGSSEYTFYESMDDGYWTSDNNGVPNSYAMSKFVINNTSGITQTLTIECINFSEQSFDFGQISKLDTELQDSMWSDDHNLLLFNGSEAGSSPLPKTVKLEVPAGEHFVTVKYRKDDSGSAGNDAFKLKFISSNIVYVTRHLTTQEYVDDAIKEVQMYKFPNTTIIGEPTINNGQVSNFTSSNYLRFPFIVDFKNQAFEIDFEFTTDTDITNQQNILDSTFGLAFAIRNSKLIYVVSYDGLTWTTEHIGTLTLSPETTYKIKLTWDKTTYTVDYSTDGGSSYTTDITFGGTSQPYPKQMFIGNSTTLNNAFTGIINLNESRLLINDKLVWQGMDDVGLASRLATDLSNIDEAGIKYIKSLAPDSKDILDIKGTKEEQIAIINEWLENGKKQLLKYNNCVLTNYFDLGTRLRLTFLQTYPDSLYGTDTYPTPTKFSTTLSIISCQVSEGKVVNIYNYNSYASSYNLVFANYSIETPLRYSSGVSITANNQLTNKKYVDDSVSVADNKIETLKTNLGGKILWSNPNPTNDFLEQDITLNSDDYDMYEIMSTGNNTNKIVFNSGKLLKGYNTRISAVSLSAVVYRDVTFINNTTLHISNSTSGNNTNNMPLYVIGYKIGLFN